MSFNDLLTFAQTVSKKEYDRRQTEERAKEHGKVGPIAKRPSQRGGGTAGEKINDYKIELATFTGLVDKLGEKINSGVNTAKQGLTQEKDKTHNALKPLVEALSKAIQRKDNKAKYEAVRALKEKINEHPSRSLALKVLEKNVRLLPFFNQCKEKLRHIAAWQTASGAWLVDDKQRDYITDTVYEAERLIATYQKFYQTNPQQLLIYYNKATQHLGKVIQRLKMEIDL